MLGKKTRESDEQSPSAARTGGGASSSTSVISKEMRIRGDCIVDGKIRIEGTISGNVQAKGLELVESGSVEGDLASVDADGSFVIAGRVDGAVRASRVDVTPTGSVLKGVEADEAHVRGRIAGGVLARRRLTLDETAVVEGDVRARKLALKEGGQVNGTIVMGDRAKLDEGSSAGSDAASQSEARSKSDARSKAAAADDPTTEESPAGDTEGDGSEADAGEGRRADDEEPATVGASRTK